MAFTHTAEHLRQSALLAACADARATGVGYLRVAPDGRIEHLPCERVRILSTPTEDVDAGEPQAAAYGHVLASIEAAAINLEDEAPSRERSLVQTKLDEARLWACEARDAAARSEG